jgi:type IV pilus assembly protein PilA
MLAKLKGKRGFTLVELMIVVAISKTAEARQMLGRITKDAAAAYQKENMSGSVLTAGGETGISQQLCATATNTVPAAKTSIQGKKYQSAASEWAVGTTAVDGWRCLKFGIESAQYFMYQYTAVTPTTATGKFYAYAFGDLNGDTTLSTFEMQGALQNGQVAISPTVAETLADE